MHASRFALVGSLVVMSLLTVARTNRAETASPALPGYAPLGQIVVDKTGCASCPVVIGTTKRHRTFVLASDSPFPILLSGRVAVTCANGSTYHVFLQSPRRSGPFQLVPNTCSNLDSKEVTVTITSVSLSPTDEDHTVALLAYGSF